MNKYNWKKMKKQWTTMKKTKKRSQKTRKKKEEAAIIGTATAEAKNINMAASEAAKTVKFHCFLCMFEFESPCLLVCLAGGWFAW